jgi:UrcA family protein
MNRLTGSRGIVTAGFALLACTLAGGAVSSAEAQARSVKIEYSDLNLATERGSQAMYRRLRSAAREVCGATPDLRELQLRVSWRECYDGAIDRAVREIGSDQLSALHARKRPASLASR